jgi:uncharacterized damage-inducible protein DinB
MNTQFVLSTWNRLRSIHGIVLRAIETIPASAFDKPVLNNVRSPKETVTHMYTLLREVSHGLERGEITEMHALRNAPDVRTPQDLLVFARAQWEQADKTMQRLAPGAFGSTLRNPWTAPMKGDDAVTHVVDEFLHARGLLYAQLRQLGVQPPSTWDLAGNEPSLRPESMQRT